jgi:hypothetical protein
MQGREFHHLLVESLPYKEMGVPPSSLYARLGGFLLIGCPVLGAAFSAFVVTRRRVLTAPILTAIAIPVFAFTVVFLVSSAAPAPPGSISAAPDFTYRAALRDFALWSFIAAALGTIPAAIVSAVLFLERDRARRNSLVR